MKIVLKSLEILTILKKLSFESMFSIIKEIYQKFNKLNNLKTRTKDNEKRKQKVLTNVADIYNELYYVYKSTYNKKIDKLSANKKKKFDYKKLRLSDNYQYLPEEEQEKQDEKTTDLKEFDKQIINEEIDLNEELFKKHFNFQRPCDIFTCLNKTNDTEKNN